MPNACNQEQHDTSKTLTVANHCKVPINQHLSVNCFSSVELKSSFVKNTFAVADIK